MDVIAEDHQARAGTERIESRPGTWSFRYRLKRGPATPRNAITLLRLKGAPSSVVNRALERAEQLDQQRKGVGHADVG